MINYNRILAQIMLFNILDPATRVSILLKMLYETVICVTKNTSYGTNSAESLKPQKYMARLLLSLK